MPVITDTKARKTTVMSRLLIISFSFGILLVAIPTVVILAANWSERLYGPLLSILFIATATVLSTLLFTLKHHKVESKFTTSVVIDEQEHLPVLHVRFPQKNMKLAHRLCEIGSLARLVQKEDGKTLLAIKRPSDFGETVIFCQELLQYKIVRDLFGLQRKSWRIVEVADQEGKTIIKSGISTPKLPSQLEDVPGTKILEILSSNRFSNSLMERAYWETISFPLPPKTRLSLGHVPSSPDSGPEKHTIRLKKPYFFVVSIQIEPIGAGTPSVLPEGIDLPPEQAKKCRTYTFIITLNAKFEKWTSGNWRTEEFKSWINWLFSEIQEGLYG